MGNLDYAWSGPNEEWWRQKKEQCARFLVLIYKLTAAEELDAA